MSMLRRLFGGSLVLLTMLIAAVGSTAASTDSEVAVTRCQTTYGIHESPPSLPAHVGVSASSSATAGLRAYSNGVLIVLAPRGWNCHAIVGADGSASMTVAAGSTSDIKQPAVTTNFADTYGTAASLACSLFATAARQLPTGVRCPVHVPRRERTATESTHLVDFTDPPHVHGDGRPSGGKDPARGLMVFVPSSSDFDGYAFTATCSLPAREAAICRTVLGDALTRIPADE
jgi:hypothetical protein